MMAKQKKWIFIGVIVSILCVGYFLTPLPREKNIVQSFLNKGRTALFEKNILEKKDIALLFEKLSKEGYVQRFAASQESKKFFFSIKSAFEQILIEEVDKGRIEHLNMLFHTPCTSLLDKKKSSLQRVTSLEHLQEIAKVFVAYDKKDVERVSMPKELLDRWSGMSCIFFFSGKPIFFSLKLGSDKKVIEMWLSSMRHPQAQKSLLELRQRGWSTDLY